MHIWWSKMLLAFFGIGVVLIQQDLRAAPARAETREPTADAAPVPGRLLVGLKPSAGPPGDELAALHVRVLEVAAGTEEAAMAALQANPAVEYVERDYRMRLIEPVRANPMPPSWPLPAWDDFVPNDPNFGLQWGLGRISAPQAWGLTQGCAEEVVIAILDTGIDQDHPDLAAQVVANVNFSDSDTVDDVYGHGTHVAGIAAAITNNGIGVAGTTFNCKLMNVKVLADDGTLESSWAAQGIVWAADHGAKVINMSFAGASGSKTLRSAVQYAARKQVVMVAATGNDSDNQRSYPAAYREVIAVGGTNQDDERWESSSYGAKWVDVAAPAVDIYSTGPNHPNAFGLQDYGTLSGTSMATAFVSGIAALVASQPSGNSVRRRIEHSTDRVPGTGRLYRYGRVNLFRALGGRDLPDLAVRALTAPRTGTRGGTIAVSMTVVNKGNSSADPYRLGIYFASDTDRTIAATCDMPALAPGESDLCSGDIEIPLPVPIGRRRIVAIADDTHLVNEPDEVNNIMRRWIIVK